MTENVVNHYAERRANENTPTTPSDLQEDLRMTTTSMLDTRDGVVAIWKKGGSEVTTGDSEHKRRGRRLKWTRRSVRSSFGILIRTRITGQNKINISSRNVRHI